MTAERVVAQAKISSKGSRRKHSIQYKLQVVRELRKPGASAREVAQRHDLHESLIGAWRRQHSQGRLGGRPEAKLLPVQLSTETQGGGRQLEASIAPRSMLEGTIHIEFSHGHRLSVRGPVAANALSAVIRELSRS